MAAHIRRYGRLRFTQTECGAPISKTDVAASKWLLPFPKCPACVESIRLRMLAVLTDQTDQETETK